MLYFQKNKFKVMHSKMLIWKVHPAKIAYIAYIA